MQELLNEFGGVPVSDLSPCYNIAPSQNVLVARQQNIVGFVWTYQRWGLIPNWAGDKKFASQYKTFNARSETITEKRSYRHSFAHKRCLIPATGFYEWQDVGESRKQPQRIHLKTGKPFLFAGIYANWTSPEGKEIESCSIITTRPNKVTRPIHDRMPVILPNDQVRNWLDPQQGEQTLLQLLKPFPATKMEAYPVSSMVNSPKNDKPACIEPIEPNSAK